MTVGEMKKEVSAKLTDLGVELTIILRNLEDEEKQRMINVMNDVDNADYPILYDIEEFDEILGGWTPSEIMYNVSSELVKNFNDAEKFYVNDNGFVYSEDDYLETYYSVFDVERFLSRNNYDVATDIDAVDYWEGKYHAVLNFQEELETYVDKESFNEDDYEYYEDFKEVKNDD